MRTALIFSFISIWIVSPGVIHAQALSDVQKNINAKNAEIQALQREVEAYQSKVTQIQGQAQSLQGTLNVINANQKQLQQSLNLTTKKSQKTELTIKQNQNQIGDLGRGISKNTQAISETIRSLNQSDGQSFLEILTSRRSISEFLMDIDQVMSVQQHLRGNIDSMQQAKSNLERAQKALAESKKELSALTSQMSDQKKIIDQEANEKKSLLTQTKNRETTYQQLLEERKKQIAALEAEIFDYESKLKFTINTTTLPKIGTEPLSWPVADVLITQRFGRTVDARRLYVSGSHSGVDFRAAVGTPVYAVADGIVEGIGDTDKTCPNASFGKWIFIRHTNGLATAYGHLSLIKVSEGQKIKTGDLVAYSGNTGRSTGPHLHLTVYASNGIDGEDGARVAERPSASCKGKVFRMPIAPTNAYLDPLLYLPKTTSTMFKN